jgi:hypothetical protein
MEGITWVGADVDKGISWRTANKRGKCSLVGSEVVGGEEAI